VLSSPAQVKVPPPPKAGSAQAKDDLADLKALARTRTPEVRRQAHYWGDEPAIEPWVQLNMKLVSEQSKNPPRTSRGYGLVSVAMNDAVVAAFHWKQVYKRSAPTGVSRLLPASAGPSYPSEHAAMAGAASRLLAYLFPSTTEARYDELAEQAADSRVAAGVNFRSDVDAGLNLGRQVADAVIARAETDGSNNHALGEVPGGPGVWGPPPGSPDSASQPVEPLAGSWRTWVPGVVDRDMPPPPPAFGSPRFVSEAREVMEIGNHLTDAQKGIANYWAAGAGTPLPPGMWNQIALDEVRHRHLTLPRLVRTFALLNMAEHDAGVAAWACKYKYWSPRPVNVIHQLGLDPNWKPFLPTPIFPSYVSGHSTYSAAGAEVLAYLFPDKAARFRAMARQAGISRIYGGIHYASDNVQGLRLGADIGRRVVAMAKHPGPS
jgi:membrane-associated phospholipid phosphatase